MVRNNTTVLCCARTFIMNPRLNKVSYKGAGLEMNEAPSLVLIK